MAEMTTKEIAELAKANGLHPNTVKYRLNKGEPIESAISRPQRRGRVAKNPKTKKAKGEWQTRYDLYGESLTLTEISERFRIRYNSLFIQVVNRLEPIEKVVERLSAKTTAAGIYKLIEALPESERVKFYELLKMGK